MSAGLVLRISVVTPLPDDLIAAGIRDADARLRDQQTSPERVRHTVRLDTAADVESARALLARSVQWPAVRDGRWRCAIVPLEVPA